MVKTFELEGFMPITYTVWTRKDRRVLHDAHCLVCGIYYGICNGEPRAHTVSKCLACGTEQCWTHGLARGHCAVCYHGLLDAFRGHTCGYAHCGRPAVAAAPRVRYVCQKHLGRVKLSGTTLDKLIQGYLAERETNWEQVTVDLGTIPLL